MSEQQKCGLCGEPMPPGEEMFQYHGYSGPCPKLPSGATNPFGMSAADEDLILAENAALKSRIDTITTALRASTELVRLQDELIVSYRAGRRPRDETLDRIGGLKVQIAANEAALGGAK